MCFLEEKVPLIMNFGFPHDVQMPRVLTQEEHAQEQEVEDSIRNEDEGEERKEEEDEEEREQEEEVGDASPQDEYDIGW